MFPFLIIDNMMFLFFALEKDVLRSKGVFECVMGV